MFTSVSSVGLGSADVCARILESLDDESRTTLEENPKLCKMFFDHAQHCCFVSQRQMVPNDFAIPTDSKAIDFDIQLDEHVKVLLSGNMREYAADVLFEHKYDESVTGAMLDCLMKCPQDIRKQLISNIILVGGSSMLPGIKSRILSQVLALCEHIEKYRSLLSLHKDAKFVALAFNSDICAWVGASLIGNSQIKTAFDINASDFDSDNSVPDWTRMQYENEAQR